MDWDIPSLRGKVYVVTGVYVSAYDNQTSFIMTNTFELCACTHDIHFVRFQRQMIDLIFSDCQLFHVERSFPTAYPTNQNILVFHEAR